MWKMTKTFILGNFLVIVIPLSIILWILNIVSYIVAKDTASWTPISPMRWFSSVGIPLYMAFSGLKKHSLDHSGAIAGFVVGFVMILTNMCFFAALVMFYITGSKFTKYKSEMKRKIEADFKEGGRRNWLQVLCNAGVATQMAVVFMIDAGCGEVPIDFSKRELHQVVPVYVSFYSTACIVVTAEVCLSYTKSWLCMSVLGCLASSSGDTWASEIGSVVGTGRPRLITTLETVPRGTNGGVSLYGLVASLLGGLVVGVAYYTALLLILGPAYLEQAPPQLPIVIMGGLCGLVGSLIDSVLGATIQYSGKDKDTGLVVENPKAGVEHISGSHLLDNHGVNLVTTLLMAFIAPTLSIWVWAFTVA